MKIIGIKTNNGYYISDKLESKSYQDCSLKGKIINGEKPEPTFHRDWVFVASEPKTVQRLQSRGDINKRWELIDKSLSDRFKLTYSDEEVNLGYDDDIDERIWLEEFKNIKPLYEFKSDKQDAILVDDEFEYITIQEIDEIKSPSSFSYKRLDNWGKEACSLRDSDIKYDIIAQIASPSLLLHTQPCKLTSKESYDIVRAYIKDNIDPKVAEISSDYNFCFAVKKKIGLTTPFAFQVDIKNRGYGRKTRQPKYETRYQTSRTVQVFEMSWSPENYKGYTPIQGFVGVNQDDLQANINQYLETIISVINEPLTDCPHCKGVGVILSENESKTM